MILTINIGILLDEVRGALGKYCVSAQRNVRRNVTYTNNKRETTTRSRSDTFAQGLKTEAMEKRKSQRSHRARQRVLSSSSSALVRLVEARSMIRVSVCVCVHSARIRRLAWRLRSVRASEMAAQQLVQHETTMMNVASKCE